MSLMGAMNSAISALAAQSHALSTIANNLANSDTTAYKSSKTSFNNLVAGTGSNTSGGVAATTRSNISQQGLVTQSTHTTHLGIEGNGFFVVSDNADSRSRYYTRNGEFNVDTGGYLVNGGHYLLGWTTDASGNPTGGTSETNLQPINLNAIRSSVEATNKVHTQANLPSEAAVGTKYQTSFEVYDALGTTSTITATYEKTAANEWKLTYADPVSPSTKAKTGTVTSAAITLKFNSTDGTLASTTPANPQLTIGSWTTGAANSTIDISLGTPGKKDGMTQHASKNPNKPDIDVQDIQQNGLAYGNLKNVQIAKDGQVVAFFDNGEQRTIYQIPIANFRNINGLTAMSNGLYARSAESGNSTLHVPSNGGAGSIKGGHLERSTVDTSAEFADMLAAQQAYSSASQIMSTSNKMFDTLLNAVR
ncbi:flagellar hook protein FlgE [Labrenzia sp. PHM005]|uniref:flagellar hook protein FlgE n=1 Tax=Labrenzia sp. PHM005 TaxID=2590016 RepID=UPI0011405D23|nr:flagellar hook protein FlgE [Labrenzia sp. PHM005]QDG76090.1 flagellar hook protein FlgE [Labrenzia sp. PHM005]